jgi:GntR family transcriptional regulator
MASKSRSRRVRPSPTKETKLASRRLDKGVARYYRLYELLSAALQDGTIAPQSALPSEPELCAQHGLSRTTVRRALDRLEREGRIVRRRGSGTYARQQEALAASTTATILRFDLAPAPAALRAIAAGIGPTAYLLERLRFVRGEPLSLTSAYLPEAIGQQIRRPIPSRMSVMTMLDRLGPPMTAVSCSVGAIPADAVAARVLEVPLGSPLLRVRAVLTADDQRLRAVLESLCRSDRLQVKTVEPQTRAGD